MSTENIDDLFRSQLGGHETPPGADLWARLQAGAGDQAPAPGPGAPERVDQLFQQQLNTHASPPPREIWERLEDEHLRPRKRRAAAWWPLAMAAAVALLLLAGGAGLWLGFPGDANPAGTMASQPVIGKSATSGQLPADANHNGMASTSQQRQAIAAAPASVSQATAATAAIKQNGAQASKTGISDLNQKYLPSRATRSTSSASSASKVGVMAQQSSRRPQGASRQPDAAAASAPLVARTAAPRHAPTLPADEPAPTPVVAISNPAVAMATPAGEIVPVPTPSPATVYAAAVAATSTLITVDVRNGAARRPSLATAVATAAAATAEHQGLGGRLLRQVGHAVRGERLSLSEVTGLPENLTLEATIGRRRVSKSIQL